MNIETGTPTKTGTYAVWLKDDSACYAARFFLIGTGWLTNLKEPLPDGAEIDGWIGPMPLRPLRESKPVASPKNFVKPVLEFDL